jgi:hypothetical protein
MYMCIYLHILDVHESKLYQIIQLYSDSLARDLIYSML